jgi:hypothetical protein
VSRFVETQSNGRGPAPQVDPGTVVVVSNYLHTRFVAAAMIDRLVHHAEILALKGDSYRLRDKDLDARPLAEPA